MVRHDEREEEKEHAPLSEESLHEVLDDEDEEAEPEVAALNEFGEMDEYERE